MSAVTVKSIASASAADRPLAFLLDGQEYRVRRVVTRDCTPETLRFVVETENHLFFRLIYHLKSETWQAHPVEEAP